MTKNAITSGSEKEELAANEQLLVRESINLLGRGLEPYKATDSNLQLSSGHRHQQAKQISSALPNSNKLSIFNLAQEKSYESQRRYRNDRYRQNCKRNQVV
jgi:hypothetical protein